MKTFVFVLAGVAVYFAFQSIGKSEGGQPRAGALPPPIDDLAHKLQDAWAGHHTIA